MGDLFVIDTAPSVKTDVEVPQYQVARKSLELTKTEEVVAPKVRGPQHFNPCWNCGQRTHAIRDCNVDVNLVVVEWNRGIQMLSRDQQQKRFQKGTGRYHENENSAGDYPNVKLGTISPKLKTIMGLSSHDLPPHVYRLRKHGYPKAWLRHTTVKPSGINLYDAHGNEVADPDAEEGEILEEEDKIRYDLSKLIQFPGFNAPMPEDAVDNYELMGVPPYNEEQSIENMIKDLKEKAVTEYRLKKERNTAPKKAEPRLNNEGIDMEVESLNDSFEGNHSVSNDFIPPLPTNKNIPPPPPSEDTICSQSDMDVGFSSVNSSQESLLTSISKTPATPSRDSLGRVLSSAEGTPLLRSRSGHTRLPPRENFSKDICDVINFENLPESTGKFEKMRGLLKKVKEALGLQRQKN